MLLKCHYCDPVITKKMREQGVKPVKSIDTEKHEFVKDEKGKYFHAECYGYYLLEKKKMSVEEVDRKVAERLLITKKEIREQEEKDKFLRWIMDYYDGTLPSYFLKKLKAVREGTYEGLNEPIDYATLLDIYQRMANYLNKIAVKKTFKNTTQRMNYDLAVVVGNYGDYKKYINRLKEESEKVNEVQKVMKEQEKVNHIVKNKKKDDSFSLTDVIDELLL